jgi:malonyl-CoA/methylmalonyl-CoA synthetase
MASLYQTLGVDRADPAARFLTDAAGRTWSYGDLAARSAQFAGALIALGVRPGDRVAVQAEKSIEGLLLYLGCVRAGAVFLPLNTAYTLVELEYFLGDAEPALVVASPERLEATRALAKRLGLPRTESLGAAPGEGSLAALADAQPTTFQDVARGDDDLAAILYTSGTTGRSKGAMLSHANLASNALTLKNLWRFSADDVLLHTLPTYHTHGLFVATNTVLAAGASMLFLPRFDGAEVVRHLPQASVLMGVPTFYTRLNEEPGLDDAARDMRLFISGSAPLLADTWNRFRERTGHPILERYGMTETNMNTSNPYDGERVAGTVGPPLPDVALRIVDAETARPLPQGEIGVIEVKGPNVFRGYWRMPDKTAAEFRADGFFITGDLGRIDENGYVSIVGRGKDLIITGGLNVYPKEVETALDALAGVEESAVVGMPHSDFGEAVAAFVVPLAGATLDPDAMLAVLREQLAAFKLPRRIEIVDALPRNAMGKVQKALLRERLAAGPA